MFGTSGGTKIIIKLKQKKIAAHFFLYNFLDVGLFHSLSLR